MNLLDYILVRLYHSKDYISGEALASELNVSRAAVSQKVAELKKSGWKIDSVTNRGYCLLDSGDLLAGALIADLLQKRGIPCGVFHFNTIDSTNTWALEHMADLPGLSLVLAEEQTAGRGRFDRSFYSPPRGGLYMSLVIKDRIDTAHAAVLTCAVAVAVRRAVFSCLGAELGIKWVNDLYLGEKKVAGILTEGKVDIESGSLINVVIGIGINIYHTDFPQELAVKAGSILENRAKEFNRNFLAAEIVHNCLQLMKSFPDTRFMDEYRGASTLIGKELELRRWNEIIDGRVVDIDDRGQLVLAVQDGSLRSFNSGEVTVNRKY